MLIEYATLSWPDKFMFLFLILIALSIAAGTVMAVLRRTEGCTIPVLGIKIHGRRRIDIDMIIDLIFIQQDVCDKHYQIGRVEIMKEQMDMAEDSIDAFISEMNKRYITVLSKSMGDRTCSSMEYVTLTSVGKQARFYILDKFRHMFKDNHILKKTPEEFNTYIENNVIIIETEFCRHYQDIVFMHSESATVMALLEEIKETLNDITIDIIKNAKVVKEKHCTELDILWASFVTKYKEVLGKDPVVRRPDVL